MESVTRFTQDKSDKIETKNDLSNITKEAVLELICKKSDRVTFCKNKTSKSNVWESFKIVYIDGSKVNFVKCEKCNNILSRKCASTTSLIRHVCRRSEISMGHTTLGKLKQEVHEDNIDNDADTNDKIISRTPSPSTCSKPMKQMISENNQQEGISQFVNFYNNSGEDEFDSAGKRIAWHLRKMDNTQRLIAEKICFDVLFYGRMNKLQEDSTVTINLKPSESQKDSKNSTEKIIF